MRRNVDVLFSIETGSSGYVAWKGNAESVAKKVWVGKRKIKYEAHPQSKFPWGRVQKQNTIAWKYLLQQIQQVFSFFFQHIRHRN
jgi:hypothetical protein